MLFSIDEGRWYVDSDDQRVRIVIQPRRSVDGNATQLKLRAEPMPLLELKPETLGAPAPAAAWVWNGTPEHARDLVLRMLGDLRSYLTPVESHSRPVRQWRAGVLNSLFKDSSHQVDAPQTKRA